MLKKLLTKSIKHLSNIIMRFFIVSILLWLFAYALPELIDSPLISDTLIQSVYYSGRKVNKLSYDDLKSKNITEDTPSEFNLNDNYYADYLHQVAGGSNLENKERANTNTSTVHTFNSNLSKSKENDEISKHNFPIGKRIPFPEEYFKEKAEFTRNLYTLYGNRTIFQMNLFDLEKTVTSAILTDGQAVIFWETLLQMKTNRAKIIYGKENNELDTEYYLFNIIGLKTTGITFLSIVIFLATHKTHVYIIKNFFIYNLLSAILTYFLLDILYAWKYYVAASIIFTQFAFCIKHLLDSFVSNFGYNKEDYDIFANIVKTKTITQLVLKLLISIVSTSLLGFFAIVKFRYFVNYILFYVCLIQLIYLISFYLQYEVHVIFQPFKHFSLILLGIINFLLTNFHRQISKFNNSISNTSASNNNDSFYLVSETFSFICISYLYEYLFTQANGIAHFFYETNSENEEFSQKVSSVAKNYKEHQKSFKLSEDCMWFFVFFICIFTSLVGVSKGKYLTFLFSLQYFKISLKVFGCLFKVKTMRSVFSTIIFILIIMNHILGYKNDNYLFDCLEITNSTTISFIKFVTRFAGLVFIILIIIASFEFIVVMNEKKELDDGENNTEQVLRKVEVCTTFEKKKKKRIKTIEIQIVKEDRTPFSFIHILYATYDLSVNYSSICLIFYIMKEVEKNCFIILFYLILLAILMIRTFFITNEFKNKFEFLYSFIFCYAVGIRILTITRYNTALYIASCIYMFIIVLYYCVTDRRNFVFTVVMLIHLYTACCSLASNYLLILIVSLICLPISIACDDSKYGCSLFRFLIPGLVILFVQLYGFKNIMASMLVFNGHLYGFFTGSDQLDYLQNAMPGVSSDEFNIVEWILNRALYLFEGKAVTGGMHLMFN